MVLEDTTPEQPRLLCAGGCGLSFLDADDAERWAATDDGYGYSLVWCPSCGQILSPEEIR